MTAALIYAFIAIGIIVIVALLLRPPYENASAEPGIGDEYVKGLWDGPGWSLAERIFDSSDYLWLRDELGFPQLAEALTRSRQQMAIKWLKAVRRSFDELVRTPEPLPSPSATRDTYGSWELLRATLRFHLVLGYAFFVVRFFGPYHRLVPAFGWMRWLPGTHSPGERYDAADVVRLP
jgi:hypothetical protein